MMGQVQEALKSFLWKDGRAVSPEEVARLRKMVEAAQGQPTATTFGGGISNLGRSVAAAISGQRAIAGEETGKKAAADVYAALLSGKTTPEAALGDPWLSADPGMSAVAASQMAQNDPLYKLKLQQAQLDYNQDQSGQGGSPETFFGTPLYTEDADGNLIANQIGNQGSFNPIELPEGQTIAPPTKEVDTGTEIITFDRFGNELFRTPKDNTGAASQTQIGKDLGAEYKVIRDDAKAARSALGSLGLMGQAINDPTFYSGIGSEQVLALKRLGAAFGIDPEGVSSMETFSALNKQSALAAMGGTLGTGFSNADRDFVVEQVPSLANTPEGNRKLIEIQSRIAQRKIEIADLATDYVHEHGSLDAGWEAALATWAEQNPLFSDLNISSETAAPSGEVMEIEPGVTIRRVE